jgi:hypothetical protein
MRHSTTRDCVDGVTIISLQADFVRDTFAIRVALVSHLFIEVSLPSIMLVLCVTTYARHAHVSVCTHRSFPYRARPCLRANPTRRSVRLVLAAIALLLSLLPRLVVVV